MTRRGPAVLATLAFIFTCLAAPGTAAADTVQTACTNAAYVDQFKPNTNYGGNISLDVLGTANKAKMSYLECVVTGVPAGATGITAQLGLFKRSTTQAGTVRLHRVSAGFTESTLKWSNRPVPDTAVLHQVPLAGTGTGAYFTMNATTVTGNGTWRFAVDAPAGQTTLQQLASDDYTGSGTTQEDLNRRPKLTVAYSLTPAAPVASFSYTPTSGQAPLAVQFTDTSTGGPTAWTWDFGDGTASTLQNPAHTYTAAGTYSATLTAANAGGTSTSSQTVTVTEAPPPPSGPTPTVPAGTAVPTTVTFADDFNGTALDLTKWHPNWHGPSDTAVTPPSNSSMTNCSDPANATVAGGDLVLTIQQRPCTAYTGTTYPWAGATLHTDGHFNVAPTEGHPVFIEARDVQLPPNTDPLMGAVGGCGPNWTSLPWITGQSWPSTGEFDVMECLGDDICWAYHNAQDPDTQLSVNKQCPAAWAGTMPATADNRHTFGVLWTTTGYQAYFDGAPTTRAAPAVEAAAKYIVLDVATSGTKVIPEVFRVGAVYAWQD